MKSALLPATRVPPALRAKVKALLKDDETISSFIEAAVIRHVELRTAQRAFVLRGLEAEQKGDWVSSAVVIRAVGKAASRAKRRAGA